MKQFYEELFSVYAININEDGQHISIYTHCTKAKVKCPDMSLWAAAGEGHGTHQHRSHVVPTVGGFV